MPTEIIHIRSPFDLHQTAQRTFQSLSIPDFEVRDSDNYPGGEYFLGRAGDIEVKVAREDDPGFDDFQYWVVLSIPKSAPVTLGEAADAMIRELLQAGFPTARMLRWEKDTVERELQTLDAAGAVQRRTDTKSLGLSRR